MQIMTRIFAVALAALFIGGCWGDIALRAPADNDQVTFQAQGKETKALMRKLEKPEAKAADEAAKAAPAAH